LEFCNSEFKFLCDDHGFARHKTVPGTPQQNGVGERMNRTILEHVRCMLFNAAWFVGGS
jgi:transposase InsO family protein